MLWADQKQRRGGSSILNRVVMEDLTRKVTFSKVLKSVWAQNMGSKMVTL